MIHFSHVYKTYFGSVHALKNVDLHIASGELVFLTGPSGAGKTTLFKVLSGFDKPSSGSVQIAEYDITKMSASELPSFRQKIGVVFQDFKLLKDRTIFENVALPLQIRGDKSTQIQKRVLEVLEQVGLGDKFDQFPDFISGGEQQRTAIARAIVHHPGLLIADEPTGNLDPRLSEEIMNLFETVSAQGTTVLIATHDHEMVQRRSKRVVKIVGGTIAEGLL